MGFVLPMTLWYRGARDAYTDGINETIYHSAVKAAREVSRNSDESIPYYLEIVRQFVMRKAEPRTAIKWCCKTSSQAKGLLADVARQTFAISVCFNATTEVGMREAARVNRLVLDLLRLTRQLTESIDGAGQELTSHYDQAFLRTVVKAYHQLEEVALATADRMQEIAAGSEDAQQMAKIDEIVNRHMRPLSCF